MNPIDAHRITGTSARLATSQGTVARTVESGAATTPASATAGTVSANPVNAGTTPTVDVDRVSEIRKAVEEGSYPIVPAKIADAMIAAGYLLRVGK
ncbi:flagellar biosynthesis anti-sigma factor FlgM [Altererythrobacter xixiisoli]|uniref:Flagellar biosynthesis anti-sigma factor FlgM n=1 Tax=Croceibacterium xixiisoli TaxID=1476466 RepID=A0A6I4TRF0_9SPHN|nr:flagellar biosynthesis anti-sigma factor FlgM [Croceibacterium xixiisoli]MXO98482.1 flagellar biosynthesis anti-sigma factor FlgM [Croceibacterium xixiisoli]